MQLESKVQLMHLFNAQVSEFNIIKIATIDGVTTQYGSIGSMDATAEPTWMCLRRLSYCVVTAAVVTNKYLNSET